MRILLVEDDKELCDGIALQLRDKNYNVDCLYTGENAVEYAINFPYQLIILDRMLPVITGTDIVTQIRKRGIQTPVLMITALSSVKDRVEGLDSGADD